MTDLLLKVKAILALFSHPKICFHAITLIMGALEGTSIMPGLTCKIRELLLKLVSLIHQDKVTSLLVQLSALPLDRPGKSTKLPAL